jgi:hypothetical protein
MVRGLLGRYEFQHKDTIDLQTAEDHFLTSKPVHLPDYNPWKRSNINSCGCWGSYRLG